MLATAQTLQIQSDADLLVAAEHTKAATAACKAIKALFKPARQSLDNAKRTIASLEAALLDGFEQADRVLRRKVTEYHVARRRQAEAERQAREAAERKRREDA
ncbi:MAG TPA: hypothetical protein VFN64_00760, partial [Burkholderiaceae bacterium]|nr:hypothetical protein [Burkholderiaceae bacterium]